MASLSTPARHDHPPLARGLFNEVTVDHSFEKRHPGAGEKGTTGLRSFSRKREKVPFASAKGG